MTVTVQSVCASAARRLNLIMVGEDLDANSGSVVLFELNALLDGWNIKPSATYTTLFPTATLTPSLQPHTIGPTGTFIVAQRPSTIDAANLVIAGQHTPLTIVTDPKVWASLSLPGQTSDMPTTVYYRPDSPNGSLFLYPIPTSMHGLELLTRSVFSQVVMTDSMELPPGYLDAVTLTLCERIAEPFNRTVSQDLVRQAREARAAVFALNDQVPQYATDDAGMPGSRWSGSYRTGWWY